MRSTRQWGSVLALVATMTCLAAACGDTSQPGAGDEAVDAGAQGDAGEALADTAGRPSSDDATGDDVAQPSGRDGTAADGSEVGVPGEPCDDDNACTMDEVWGDDGACAADQNIDCDDGDPCTSAGCDPVDGCLFERMEDNAACTDGDPCTIGDHCVDGDCVGSAVECDDGDPCVVHTGCANDTGECLTAPVPDGTVCDDDNKCTSPDACSGGVCTPGGATVCEDGNDCTDDGCTPHARARG